MELTKMYTKVMHKALQNALRNNFRLDYQPSGELIRFLYNTKQGVVFKFNTILPWISATASEGFLKTTYEDAIKDLEVIYNNTQTNRLSRLRKNYIYQKQF